MSDKKCFASQHMHPREWGVLEVCLRLTNGGKNNLFLDGRKMSERFAGITKNVIYRSVERLTEMGWLVQVGPRTKNADTQRYEKSIYRVLAHDEWIEEHGASACSSSPAKGTGSSPQNGTGSSPASGNGPVPFSKKPVPFLEKPVPPVGHSSVIHNSVKESSEKINSVDVAPLPEGGDSSFGETGQLPDGFIQDGSDFILAPGWEIVEGIPTRIGGVQ